MLNEENAVPNREVESIPRRARRLFSVGVRRLPVGAFDSVGAAPEQER